LYKHFLLPLWKARPTPKQFRQLWETPPSKKGEPRASHRLTDFSALLKGALLGLPADRSTSEKAPPHYTPQLHSRPGLRMPARRHTRGICTWLLENRCKWKAQGLNLIQNPHQSVG